jgi:glycosyltransferase involved in cell wall biosynthesis
MLGGTVINSSSAMAGEAIKVTLCQAAAAYQATLPARLVQAGMLRRVLRFGPELQILEPDGAGSLEVVKQFALYKALNRCLWSAWGLLPGRGRPQLPILATSWLAGRLASSWVSPGGIFHSLPGLALPTLQAGGSKTLLENATLHPSHWQREVLYECAQFGVRPRACSAILPPTLIRRLEREYELCDIIIVPSTTARRSFEDLGLGDKTLVIWPGVDERFFSPTQNKDSSAVFRACFVGRIEVSKGIAYLLQAWKLLALPQAELVLVGPVQPEMRSILKRYLSSNVTLTGPLPPHAVAGWYHASNVFVHPSSNEGLGLVLLESMACGVPVIATDRTGAEDCVTHGEDGFIVPARNVNELAEAILWCYRHRHELPAMGRIARRKIEHHFTRAHYEERQIALYRSLLGRPALPKNSRQHLG